MLCRSPLGPFLLHFDEYGFSLLLREVRAFADLVTLLATAETILV